MKNKKKLTQAFSYLLSLVSGVYGAGWEISEAIADAVIEFNLRDKEARKLRRIYRRFKPSFNNYNEV